MRIAVIIVVMSVVTTSSTTSSEASRACMSRAEARQQFPSVHIYWHGRGHCWDATPAQRHRIGRVQRKTPVREAQRKAVQPKIEEPEWRESRSEMLADNGPVQLPQASQSTRPDDNEKAAPGTPWALRWVDVQPTLLSARVVEAAPAAPPPAPPPITEARKPEPLITLRGLALMGLAFALMIGTIKILIFVLIYERRQAESHYWGNS